MQAYGRPQGSGIVGFQASSCWKSKFLEDPNLVGLFALVNPTALVIGWEAKGVRMEAFEIALTEADRLNGIAARRYVVVKCDACRVQTPKMDPEAGKLLKGQTAWSEWLDQRDFLGLMSTAMVGTGLDVTQLLTMTSEGYALVVIKRNSGWSVVSEGGDEHSFPEGLFSISPECNALQRTR
jgi:hypothetical protein